MIAHHASKGDEEHQQALDPLTMGSACIIRSAIRTGTGHQHYLRVNRVAILYREEKRDQEREEAVIMKQRTGDGDPRATARADPLFA